MLDKAADNNLESTATVTITTNTTSNKTNQQQQQRVQKTAYFQLTQAVRCGDLNRFGVVPVGEFAITNKILTLRNHFQ